MSKGKWIFVGVVMLVALGIGWYAISPLFRDIEVHDELPENIMLEEVGTAAMGEDGEMTGMTTSSADGREERFEVVGTTGHPASGFVRVLETTDGTVIRYEDFETINGPNLHMYLAKDLDAKEYIDLGAIKGTRGSINYSVPADIDVSEYRYVMYWCVPFSVLFNYAEIR